MLKKFKNWHSGLSKLGKVTLWTVVGISIITVLGSSAEPEKTVNVQQTSGSEQELIKEPEVTEKTITETESIPFTSSTTYSASLEKGEKSVTTTGVNGVKTITYTVAYEDGKEISKTKVKEEVTTKPVTQVTTVGTKEKVAARSSSNCDPNYSGACVPIASDVDCASGSGNGPAYVSGPVRVIGYDIYDLDRDGNGYGCEP